MDKSARPTIASIDVGTTKVCTLVGETSESGELRIVGVGVSPSRGLRKGIVVNATEAAEAIVASVERAERISGYDIAQAHVGIAGAHIASLNSRGVVGIPHGERGITDNDVARALEASRAVSIPENHHVLHVIPRGYSIDGQEGVSDPRGMYGARLEVEAHIVTGSALSIQNLVKCVHSLNMDVDQLGSRAARCRRGCPDRYGTCDGRCIGRHWRRNDRHCHLYRGECVAHGHFAGWGASSDQRCRHLPAHTV